MRFRVERRLDTPRWLVLTAQLASVVIALLFAALLMMAAGQEPVHLYGVMLRSAVGTWSRFGETVVKAIPLIIIGLGVSVPMRMRIWNIGAEGQFYMGAAAASWLALFHPELPAWVLLPTMLLLGILAGGIWSGVAGVLRAYWNINEVITTLMLNYIALLWVAYLVNGPWRDPAGQITMPFSANFVPAAQLPTIAGTRVHVGLFIGLALALLMAVILKNTRWGYEIRVIGNSTSAARYAGMNVARSILVVMFVSGAMAGIAGVAEVSGVIHHLQDQISPGYGFTAIIVAALARLNPIGIVVVSLLFGSLLVGGYAMQSVGLSATITYMLQGTILFVVLASEFFLDYRIEIIKPSAIPVQQPTLEEVAR
jgi:general nucleoside transport system permease protein